MKRIISLVLCLVMCFSVFSTTAVQASALGTAGKIFSVRSEAVKNGKITYTVSVNSGVEGMGGAVILVEYDDTVLSPVEDTESDIEGAAIPSCSSTGMQNFNGIFTSGRYTGYYEGKKALYTVGYTTGVPEAKLSSNKDFFTITFEVIDERKPKTFVNFYCREFLSTKGSDQSITIEDGLQEITEIKGVTTLEPPELESATLLTNAIELKWKEAVGAEEYEIYRMISGGAWGEPIATVSAGVTEYIDDVNLESGNTYIYSVKSKNDETTTLRAPKGVSCKYVSKPGNVTAQCGIGGVDITWEKITGADKFQIVRREYGSEEWTVVGETGGSKNTFKDTTAGSGKVYEYDVNSVLGNFVTETLPEGEIVSYVTAPIIYLCENVIDGIQLEWTDVENALYYTVYRKAISDGKTEFEVYKDYVTSNYLKDTDEEVEPRKLYVYTVQAVSQLGDKSDYSKTGYAITRVPATTVNEVVTQEDSIKVSWDNVDEIDGYVVYRKTEESDWVKAGTVNKDKNTYEDKDAQSGKAYYYCVAARIGSSESVKISTEEKVYYLKSPQDIVAVNTKDNIKINWVASEGATEYKVYRKDVLTSEVTFVTTTEADVTECVDEDVELDAIYAYFVQAISSDGASKESRLSAEVRRIECVKKIKSEIDSKGIKVSWSEHDYADYYIVCRKTDGDWTRLAETKKVSYVDKKVKSGEVYTYSVIPVIGDFEGGIDESILKGIKYLSKPEINDATILSDGIKIYWAKVDGAKTYEIQRAPLDSAGERDGSYKKIADVKSSQRYYKDTSVKAGKGYVYRVYAVDSKIKSVASDGYKAVFLETQKIKSLSSVYAGVKITWEGTEGAKNYRIYRKESGGEWVLVTKVSGSKRSYTDKKVKNGVKTYYAVKAQNGNSISTYKSKSITHYAAPKAEVENRTSAITVTWKKISGTKSYYVYRKGPGDKSFKKVATVTKNIYTDNNVKNGKTYKYTVKAYNGKKFSAYNKDGWTIKRLSAPKLKSITNNSSGITLKWSKVTGASKYIVMRKQSGFSKWVELKTTKSLSFTDKTAEAGKIYVYSVKAGYGDHRSTYIADGLKMKRLSRPSLASVKSTKKGITFKWKDVTGASGYLVYRKTGSGKWEEIAKVTGASTISYLDKTAKKGKTYYYSVRAYSGAYKSAYNTKGLKIKDKY